MKNALLPGVPWVESPFFDFLLPSKNLSKKDEELVRSYRENGYISFPFVMKGFDDAVARIIDRLEPHYKGERRLQDAWKFNEDVKRVACHEPILDFLRMLYGREPIPFQTLNFPVGTEQPLHCDAAHFNSMPERFMCGVWVAFEDVDETNGPLAYVPGSHKLPCYSTAELCVESAADKTALERNVYGPLWQELPKALGLELQTNITKKGEAFIWSANLLHGGHHQLDRTRTRHSQVTHYYFEDCAYYTPFLSDPFLGRIQFRDVIDIKTGKRIKHSYAGKPISTATVNRLQPYEETIVNSRPLAEIRKTSKRGQPSEWQGGCASFLSKVQSYRFENVSSDLGVIEPDRIFLHPNPPDAPPARLVLEGIYPDCLGITFDAYIEHERSEPVVLNIIAIVLDSVMGQSKVESRHIINSSQTSRRLSSDWPGHIHVDKIIIEVEMHHNASSNEYAWLYLKTPVFINH